jgi:hypothetical protein
MKTYLLSKIPLCVMALTGATVALGALGQPSQAQPFPGRVFGCSIPGDAVRDNPFGLGAQPANALIVTTNEYSGVPVQGSIATFSQVGNVSGQGRCIEARDRLNALNISALSNWVFDVGTTVFGDPAICFRPPGGYCGTMTTAIGSQLPGGANSFQVFALATGQTAPAVAVGRLTTNMGFMMEARNTLPIRD